MGKLRFGPGEASSGSEAVVFTAPAYPLIPQPEPLNETIIYVDKPIETIKEIEKIVYVDKPVEVIKEIEVVKEVIVEKEKPVEVIKIETVVKEVIVEKPVEIVKYIDRLDVRFKLPVWVLVALAVQSAVILALLVK